MVADLILMVCEKNVSRRKESNLFPEDFSVLILYTFLGFRKLRLCAETNTVSKWFSKYGP